MNTDQGASAQMPRYRSHKEVWALKISKVEGAPSDEGLTLSFEGGFAPLSFSWSMFARYKPVVGDYYVVYADGYKSISPAAAFEEGYTRCP